MAISSANATVKHVQLEALDELNNTCKDFTVLLDYAAAVDMVGSQPEETLCLHD